MYREVAVLVWTERTDLKFDGEKLSQLQAEGKEFWMLGNAKAGQYSAIEIKETSWWIEGKDVAIAGDRRAPYHHRKVIL